MNNLAVAKPMPVVPPVISALFPLNLSMFSPVFICFEALHTQEYDKHSGNARIFVRSGNYYSEAPPGRSKGFIPDEALDRDRRSFSTPRSRMLGKTSRRR